MIFFKYIFAFEDKLKLIYLLYNIDSSIDKMLLSSIFAIPSLADKILDFFTLIKLLSFPSTKHLFCTFIIESTIKALELLLTKIQVFSFVFIFEFNIDSFDLSCKNETLFVFRSLSFIINSEKNLKEYSKVTEDKFVNKLYNLELLPTIKKPKLLEDKLLSNVNITDSSSNILIRLFKLKFDFFIDTPVACVAMMATRLFITTTLLILTADEFFATIQ